MREVNCEQSGINIIRNIASSMLSSLLQGKVINIENMIFSEKYG